MEPSQIQDLGDAIPDLLKIKTKYGMPLRFHVRMELGDGEHEPSYEAVGKIQAILQGIRGCFVKLFSLCHRKRLLS